MRLSSIVLFVFSVLMGLGAVVLTINWMEGQRVAPVAATAPIAKSRKVVVAAQPLRFGTELTSLNLKEVEWPEGATPEGAFAGVAELTRSGGRRVALGAIERSEPILSTKITGAGQRATLSALISGDKKAITIRVDDVSGAAGFLLPGDRVDVLLTRTKDDNGYTDVLLQNIRALGIDQLADERTEKPTIVKAITLEVSTPEAQKLALAERVGRLSLLIRQAGAIVQDSTRRIKVTDLGEPEPTAPPAPAREPEPPREIETAEAPFSPPPRDRGASVSIIRPKKEGDFIRDEREVKRAGRRS